MKKIFLIAILVCYVIISKATIHLIVVAPVSPPLNNLCPGDTLRFVGDSLNSNFYGTVQCTVYNLDSSHAYCSVTSYINVATSCDHILRLGDVAYDIVPFMTGMINFNCITSNGNAEEVHSGISIYPNPAIDQIHLSSDDFDRLSIYDISGNKIEDVKPNRVLNISNLVKGIYFVRFESEKNIQYISFIKR